MSASAIQLTAPLQAYLQSVAVREPDVLARLHAETQRMPRSIMQITPEQGALMALLVELIGARRCIEVGVYTGYSTLAVALALPPDGRVVACDINPEWTAIAERYWRDGGVRDKIELRLALAPATLDDLITAGAAGRFDFAFVDANKEDYDQYYERCLALLRVGGLLAIDNVLWFGNVIDPTKTDPDTLAIRTLNAKLHADARVSIAMVPIGDGLTLARKRA
ncbi:MAG: SAM-dependent methyltransferase [Alphaproteobacteria bacterium]|nr:SAM-dependent methyltransferase [Alphaproteobacteria bacterium]